mmetsp:Transcript_2247/g.4731  ORF Transcript_2247/g.4731 Transcript_2247/m.4731 type:complete len:90 (-) Transcript_2247:843-1112(-)
MFIHLDSRIERCYYATKGYNLDLLGWTKRYDTTQSKRTAASEKTIFCDTATHMRNSFLFLGFSLLSDGTGDFCPSGRGGRTPQSIEIPC